MATLPDNSKRRVGAPVGTDVSAGPGRTGWTLRAEVPDRIFTLGVEVDDDAADAEHEAFVDTRKPDCSAWSPPSVSMPPTVDVATVFTAAIAFALRAIPMNPHS